MTPSIKARVIALGTYEYESLFAAQVERALQEPIHFTGDEWDAIALNYTSGTTGEPKGVVYSHRGAQLAAISNILEWDLPSHVGLFVDLADVSLQWLDLPVGDCGPRRCQRVLA
jgi:long-subunit acyl-CoA synthetase (AMP-forming)